MGFIWPEAVQFHFIIWQFIAKLIEIISVGMKQHRRIVVLECDRPDVDRHLFQQQLAAHCRAASGFEAEALLLSFCAGQSRQTRKQMAKCRRTSTRLAIPTSGNATKTL